MSQSILLSVAMFVFAMMAIGLGLTIREFRHGQPEREDRAARARSGERENRGSAQEPQFEAR